MTENKFKNFEAIVTPCILCDRDGKMIRRNTAAARVLKNIPEIDNTLPDEDIKDILKLELKRGFSENSFSENGFPFFIALKSGKEAVSKQLATVYADTVSYNRREAVMLLLPDVLREDFAATLFPSGVPRDITGEGISFFLEKIIPRAARPVKYKNTAFGIRTEKILRAFLRISSMVIDDVSEGVLTDAPMRSDVISDIIGYACFKILSPCGINVAFSNRISSGDSELVNFRLFTTLAVNHIMLHPAVSLGIPVRVSAESGTDAAVISVMSERGGENFAGYGLSILEKMCCILPDKTVEYLFLCRAVKNHGCLLDMCTPVTPSGTGIVSSLSVPVLIPERLKAKEELKTDISYIKSRIDRYVLEDPELNAALSEYQNSRC